jgi:hypothetical protein
MSAAHLWQLSQYLGVPLSYFFEGLPIELSVSNST